MDVARAPRMFLCRRCQAQVVLCSRCDRGQVYCQRGCAAIARRETLRRAGRDYQASEVGRANHAARQARYIQRKMTHHTSGVSEGSPGCQASSEEAAPEAGPEAAAPAELPPSPEPEPEGDADAKTAPGQAPRTVWPRRAPHPQLLHPRCHCCQAPISPYWVRSARQRRRPP